VLDLHTHSSASDGQDSPRELVRHAKERGLTGIALTDHDTCAGLADAIAAGLALGVAVLPGIELSAEWCDKDVHILGYWINQNNRQLTALTAKLRAERTNRIVETLERLGELGLPLTLSEVRDQSGRDGHSLGRPHVARALCKRGYVASFAAAFDLYLERGRPAYVPRYKLSPREAIRTIIQSGGVAVWAHPGALADLLLKPLVKDRLQGVEVYHPDHDVTREHELLALAREHSLVVTGGSDAHFAPALGTKSVGTEVWYELWSRR